MTTAISDWQDQADAKISADCSWRRGVFESTGWHRGDRSTDLGAAAARRRSEAGAQIGGDARLVQVEGRSRSVRQSARLRPACRGAGTVLGVGID
jgi:hypothetical protein